MTRTAVGTIDPNDHGNDFITLVEAAKILSVDTRTMYRYVDEGLIRGYRLGRLIGIRRRDLDRLRDST